MASAQIQRALLSVSDKRHLSEFAQGLAARGIELYSTGGTRRHLEELGLEVHDIAGYTGFPELMGGRLKTLHPKVAGGLLARRDNPGDVAALREHNIATFDLVVVNLYPFQETIADPDVSVAEAIEQIDIGGPTMVRAAAKNHAFVTIVTDPSQYASVLAAIEADGGTSQEQRRELAGAAFALTAQYDRAIADYFAAINRPPPADEGALLPEQWSPTYQRRAALRYGENPHQSAAVYGREDFTGPSLLTAEQLNGKELSYNNLLDLDSALTIVRHLPAASAAVLKHNNPCGAAQADDLATALRRAFDGDPVSAFGSVVGVNQTLDGPAAEVLVEPGRFVEAVVAPEFTPEALQLLTTVPKWKTNVRLMQIGPLDQPQDRLQVRHLEGGLLVQEADAQPDEPSEWSVVTETQPDAELREELQFAWAICRHVKSNAIVLCREKALVGAGAGQMSRVDSVEIAIRKAGDRSRGAVIASDAFFPFDDSIQPAAEAGVRAVIQPGGSRRDEEVIAACDRHQLPMIFTGRRHFRH